MEDLGKYLRNIRESSAITYKKIWQDIKISEDQIKAIESNDLFRLGNYGFCKALIYNYARYLEADTDQVMREFRVLMPESTKKTFIPSTTVKEKKILLSTNFLWMIGLSLFILILGSILFAAYRSGYLSPPQLFSESEQKDSDSETYEPSETEPDSLREHMKTLSESFSKANKEERSIQPVKKSKKKKLPQDSTDYIGQELGESPLNVETR